MPKEHTPIMSPLSIARPSTIPIKRGGTFQWGVPVKQESEEADSSSNFPSALRSSKTKQAAGMPKAAKQPKHPADRKPKQVPKLKIPKPPASTTESSRLLIRTHFKESDGQVSGQPEKFRVILIQEGMGNLKDCFYYTKDCLKNSVNLFEGVKCFADHADQLQEQIHPERSTKDVLGHYEDVEYVENEGRGALEATLVLCEGTHFDWAKSLLTNALKYATKYQDKDFVGLSINAQGEAGQVGIQEFMKSQPIPESVQPKLQQAMDQGIEEIRPVSALKDAVSCDLVTEAGAGGRILTMMERDKRPMKNKKPVREAKQAGESHEEAGDDAGGMAGAGDGGTPDHADAGQDAVLFKKMISQYLGKDAQGVDQEEAMGMAQGAHEHFMKQGMESHEAYEAAGEHLKNSMGISKMMKAKAAPTEESEESEEGESHEAEEHEESEDDLPPKPAQAPPAGAKKKGPPMTQESNKKLQSELISTKAEVAKLRESVARMQVRDHLSKKIAESNRSPEFIKQFKEALGVAKSVDQVNQFWTMFEKAYDAGSASVDAIDDVLGSEKTGFRESGARDNVISLSDCMGE